MNLIDILLCLQLKQKKHSFGFGAGVELARMTDPHQVAYQDFVYKHFEWAVIVNALKWRHLEWTKVKTILFVIFILSITKQSLEDRCTRFNVSYWIKKPNRKQVHMNRYRSVELLISCNLSYTTRRQVGLFDSVPSKKSQLIWTLCQSIDYKS